MSALLEFKLSWEYALMHVCHVVESKCIFVWTILVTVKRLTTMVTYDAGLISGLLLCMSRSQSRQGRLYFHFS